MKVDLNPVPAEVPTFAGAVRCERLEELEADVALFASRLLLNFMGAMAHSGQIGRRQGGES